jgi:multicomponent Na+:H+ antiporter subunit B
MSRRVRTVLCLAGAVGVAVLLLSALPGIPPFGGTFHPYRDAALDRAIRHTTPNVVSSVNFDQRAIDTLGEEFILLAAVVGAAALLRPTGEEPGRAPKEGGYLLPATRFMGYLLLPVTVLVGFDVVVHGHLTAGGGFQGGVVLATGWHLLYISGSYPALARLRPLDWHEYAEAAGAAAFVLTGTAGLVTCGAFLANLLPLGTFGSLLSAGTVPLLNIAVGVAVASGVIVLLAQFLRQAVLADPEDVN